MSHQTFRLLFILILVFGAAAIQAPPSAHAAGPWYVVPAGSDSNDCLSPGTPCATINGAIAKASSGDFVNVAEGIYIGTGSEVVLIDKDINLLGGWDTGFTSQNGTSIIDGEGARRGITINSVTAVVERFTIQNGFQDAFRSGGGGIFNNLGTVTLNQNTVVRNKSTSDFTGGGGIYNNGTMILNNSAITGNSTDGYQSGGAGIYNQGTMTLNNSSISRNISGANSGGGNPGGGIYNPFGSMTLNNTTVSNNRAGGGAGIDNGGTLIINSSTISHNTAISGGGIYSTGGSVTLQNSILAENKGLWPDCVFPPISAGYNIIGDATSCNFSPTSGDQINIDPKIGLLIGDPGYHPLLSDSPAIDAGNPAGCMGSSGLLTSDQREALRVGTCDIGAYEYTTPGAATSLAVVSGNGQSAAPSFDFPKPLQVAAIDNLGSPVSSVTVDFTAPNSGPSATFFSTGTNTTSVNTDEGGVATTSTFTANNQFGAYIVSASASGVASVNFNLMNTAWYVTTTGNDSNSCSSSGNPCATINGAIGKAAEGDTVFVAAGTYTGSGTEVVSMTKSIRLIGGWDDGFSTQNGTSIIDGQRGRLGIQVNYFTSAIIDRFTVQNGSAGAVGGIWNNGALTINSSTIKENGGLGSAGGILNLGALTVNNSSIINNRGSSGGGISNGSGGFALLATANLNNSTISGNSSDSRGGGINNESTGTLTLNNTTIYDNHDIFFPGGGGIYNSGGNVTMRNSILAGNSNSNGGGMDCNGTILSSDYNLISNTSGCTFIAGTGDLTNIDPNLGQLIGPSEAPSYHPLFAGSPAIDAGNPAGCTDQNGNILSTDQRGVARVGNCDMGSYEYTTPGPAASLAIVGGDNQSTTTTLAFPEPLQAATLDNQGSPVSGVTIDFTAPASGPSGTFADSGTNVTSVNTDASGVATTSIFTANDQEGVYNVSASASGLGSVSFNLEQITRATNDNFAHAKEITLLPFSDSVDNTNTTIEPGEPHFCGSATETQSVWYSFTPATNIAVIADMEGSSFSDANLTIFQAGGPGFDGLNFVDRACFGGSITLNLQAGATYYIQAESFSSGGGDLHLNLRELAHIGSISGQVIDAVTGNPVSATFFPSVNLNQCNEFGCFTINSQTPDSDGRFRFDTDYNGNPLTVGTYQVVAFADQYEQGQTDPFDVGDGEQRVIDVNLNSFPVRFSEIQPCDNLPATGGDCVYSVKITNGSATQIQGAAWSLVDSSLPGSFAGFTNFQTKQPKGISLASGRSQVLQFNFHVPANNSLYSSSVCTQIYVGQGTPSLFNTVGQRNLFCVFRGATGFTITSFNRLNVLSRQSQAKEPVRLFSETLNQQAIAAANEADIEPNDTCLTAQDIGTVTLPFTLNGILDSSQIPDVDFFKITGTPDAAVIVDLEGQGSGKGTVEDPFLGAFDSSCNLIGMDDDSGGNLNSRLEFTIPSDGIYVLAATVCCDSGFNGGGNGSYQLTVAPLQVIGSISGRVTDAATGQFLRGDVAPFAYVRLLLCEEFGCFEVNAQSADVDGRFHFTSYYDGRPLRPGSYQVAAEADQYQPGQTDSFSVGEGENRDIGDVALQSYPVRFSNIQPCVVPSGGGICEFSVTATNGLLTRLEGKAWSMVNGSGLGSFIDSTNFQTGDPQNVNLGISKNKILRFRFRLPGTVSDGAFICAQVFVGQGKDAFFNTVGWSSLFCFQKGISGFTLMSEEQMHAQLQLMRSHEASPTRAPSTPKR